MRLWKRQGPASKEMSAEALRKQGARALARNRPRQAIPPLEAALEQEPASFEGRINLATAYYLTHRYDKAVPHLRYVLALEEHHPTALLNLAACLDARGNLQESIQCLEKLLRARPRWKDGHYNLAIAHLKNHDKTAAVAALKQELELNPGHRAARDLLNRLYLTTPVGESVHSPEKEAVPETDDG